MERQRRISTFHMLSTNYRFHFAINLQETRTHRLLHKICICYISVICWTGRVNNWTYQTGRRQPPQSWQWRTSESGHRSWSGTCPIETPTSPHSPAQTKWDTQQSFLYIYLVLFKPIRWYEAADFISDCVSLKWINHSFPVFRQFVVWPNQF